MRMTEEHKAALKAGRERKALAALKASEGGEEESNEGGGHSPLQAIRANCLSCCGEGYSEVEKCHSPKCHLWPFRFGKRPATAATEGRLVDPERFVCTCGLKGTSCNGRGAEG